MSMQQNKKSGKYIYTYAGSYIDRIPKRTLSGFTLKKP